MFANYYGAASALLDSSKIAKFCQTTVLEHLQHLDVNPADAPQVQRMLAAAEDVSVRVQRAYLLAFEAVVMPEVMRFRLEREGHRELWGDLDTHGQIRMLHMVQGEQQSPEYSVKRRVPFRTQSQSSYSSSGLDSRYTLEADDGSNCNVNGLSSFSKQASSSEAYWVTGDLSHPLFENSKMTQDSYRQNVIVGHGSLPLGSMHPVLAQMQNMNTTLPPESHSRILSEMLEAKCSLKPGPPSDHPLQFYSAPLTPARYGMYGENSADMWPGAATATGHPIQYANLPIACATDASLLPPQFYSLPLGIQHRVWSLTKTSTTLSLQDFDEKVVGKMIYMVERYGEGECLSLLDKLSYRMRKKHTAMRNGAGYLDTAMSTHLDVLMVQRSHPGGTSLQEYAKHVLRDPLYKELASAINANHWLSWEVWDQGVVSLLSKLPEDRAISRLKEISSRSFRNVDNITGCITTILSSVNRSPIKPASGL